MIDRNRDACGGCSFSCQTFPLCPPLCPCRRVAIALCPVHMLMHGEILCVLSVFCTTPKPMSLTPCRTLTFLSAILSLSTSPALGELPRVRLPFATKHWKTVRWADNRLKSQGTHCLHTAEYHPCCHLSDMHSSLSHLPNTESLEGALEEDWANHSPTSSAGT